MTHTHVAQARRQRGAAAVVAALWLVIAAAALGALDVGNVFVARRQLQRTADMAAAAGAQSIGGPDGCDGARLAAQSNATGNGLQAGATVTVTCGRWDAAVAGGPPVFSAVGAPLNAVQVDVARTVPYLFLGPARTVHASATAKAIDIGSFSLATSTLNLSGGVLNNLLNALLGTNLNLGVLTWQGMASAQVKLGDLATALNIGSITQLLNTTVKLSDLVNALVTVIGPDGTVSADVKTALGTIAASIPNGLEVKLGDDASGHGLLAVGLENPEGATSAKVSVLDSLLVAAEIANGQKAINLGGSLNLAPLASVTTQVAIVEPPVVAVGEAGVDANGVPRTSAHSAQVRLALDVRALGSVNGSAVDLPLYIEAANATANLQSTQCTGARTSSVSTIAAQTGIASLCIGGGPSTNMTNITGPLSCTQPAMLVNLQLLGVSIWVNPLNVSLQSPQQATLSFDAQPGNSDDYQSIDTNALGGATAGLLAQLAAQVPTSLHVSLGSGDNPVDLTQIPLIKDLVTAALTLVVNLLTPILNLLDTALVPLLQALGVQIGAATVHDTSLTCGEAQLVN